MGIINYAADLDLLVVARGHPYQKDDFSLLFDGLTEYRWSLVEQPAAQRFFHPDTAAEYAAIVCYDMPGVDFTAAEDPPALVAPSEEYQDNTLAMLEAGIGMVFMHHAIAGWPAWPEYAKIVGGRFHYRPAELAGKPWPDSGYRHQVEHSIAVLGSHPVTAGLPARFDMVDELYLCPTFDDAVIPLLRSNYRFDSDSFYSAKQAVEGTLYSREGWNHPAGSGLVGWVKHYKNSPIVYLQGGDDAAAFNNVHYQALLHNAVRWVSSSQAHDWAQQQYKKQQGQ